MPGTVTITRARRPGRVLRVGALTLLGLLVAGAVGAPDAAAFGIPVPGVPSPGDVIEKALDFVLKTLFGGVPSTVTRAAVAWQLHLPSEAFTDGNVDQLRATTTAAAFALLGLVMTASVLRYWLSGLTDGGTGGEAFTGFVKSIGAALGIVAWPWFFGSCVLLTNSFTHGLVYANSVEDDLSRMIGAAVGMSLLDGPVGALASIVLVVAGTLLMLGLFALHIVLACALVVLFVGGPLLIVLTPFPGTAWMPRLAFRAFATLLAWPVIWALCFAAFAAVFADFVSFKGDGGVLDKALLKPLTGVAMLYLCVKLPLVATRASMMNVGGQGFLGFAGRFIAVRQLERGLSTTIAGRGAPASADKPAATGDAARDRATSSPAHVSADDRPSAATTTPTARHEPVTAGEVETAREPQYPGADSLPGSTGGPPAGAEQPTSDRSRLAGTMRLAAASLPAGRAPGPDAIRAAMTRLGDQAPRMATALRQGNLADAAFNNAAAATIAGDHQLADAYQTIGTAALHTPQEAITAIEACHPQRAAPDRVDQVPGVAGQRSTHSAGPPDSPPASAPWSEQSGQTVAPHTPPAMPPAFPTFPRTGGEASNGSPPEPDGGTDGGPPRRSPHKPWRDPG